MTKQVIEIQGMGCDHCVHAVRKALEAIDGLNVEEVEIGRAVVTTDGSALNAAVVAKAIEQAGYSVTNS